MLNFVDEVVSIVAELLQMCRKINTFNLIRQTKTTVHTKINTQGTATLTFKELKTRFHILYYKSFAVQDDSSPG